MKSTLFLLLIFLSALPAARAGGNFAYHLSPSTEATLTQEQKTAVLAWFEDAMQKLPPIMKAKLARMVDIEFSTFGDSTGLPIPDCHAPSDPKTKPDKRILGETIKPEDITKANHILIHAGFLPEIVKGPSESSSYDCGHRNLYALALATLLHETSHVYDFAKFQSPNSRTVSRDPMLMNLFGAVEVGSLLQHRVHGELSSMRSPESYEFTNTDEAFAVNMEFFLLDPEYACRRPSIHRIFAAHFGFDPFPNRTCTVNYTFPVSSEKLSETLVNLTDLNPKRLYQVDYLYASKGDQLMSKWGHAMIRLAFCSPEHAANPGPECMKDLPYHFVASFRANVTDTHINNWKGIEGDYPSQLFILPLLEVMEEYNSRELRELVSLPLKLSEEQKRNLLERSLEMGWEYRGRYFFFGNNCATEALHLMQDVIDEKALQAMHIVTPSALYSHLVKAGYADDSVLQNREEAIQAAYVFPSSRVRLEAAYGKLEAAASGSPIPSLEDYLHKTKASERLALSKSLFAKLTDPGSKGNLAAEFFMLENYIHKSLEDAVSSRITTLIYATTQNHEMSDTLNVVRDIEQKILPAALASSGYGIALAKDYPPDLSSTMTKDSNQMSLVMEQLKAWIMKNDGSDFAEMQAVLNNLHTFASEVQ